MTKQLKYRPSLTPTLIAHAIALAKHFKLTAHDIDCSEHKALQEHYAQIEEDSFDSDAKLHAEIAELNRKLTMKGVN